VTNLEPEAQIRNFLRSQLTDYNSAERVGGAQWIYDDWPNDRLSANSFPRIVVRKMSEAGKMIGISDNETWDEIIVQIDVLVHGQLGDPTDPGVLTITHTDEAVGDIANSPRISFDRIAHEVTNVKHDGSAFGTVTGRINDSDFTSATPGAVEWSKSTGNLAFAAADLTTYAGEAITSTYSEKLQGEQLAKRIGREVAVAIRDQWRQDEFLDGLAIPDKMDGPKVVEFGIPEGWHRVMLEYRWRRLNTGEEV